MALTKAVRSSSWRRYVESPPNGIGTRASFYYALGLQLPYNDTQGSLLPIAGIFHSNPPVLPEGLGFRIYSLVVGRNTRTMHWVEQYCNMNDGEEVDRDVLLFFYMGQYHRGQRARNGGSPLLAYYRCNQCKLWSTTNSPSGRQHLLACDRCALCRFRIDPGQAHTCSQSMSHLQPDYAAIGRGRYRIAKPIEAPIVSFFDRKDILLYDFETFANASNPRMQVYSVGAMTANCAEPSIYFGPEALNQFVQNILDYPGSLTCYGWNSSGFDHIFILAKLQQLGYHVSAKNLIKKGKRTVTFSVVLGQGRTMRFRDAMLFIMDSLANACKAFNVPSKYQKGDFDHGKVYSWATAEQWRHEVVPYLKNDVQSLRYILCSFGNLYAVHYHLDVCEYITLPHLSRNAWLLQCKAMTEKIVLPTVPEYERFRPIIRGGRCQPQIDRWELAGCPDHPSWNDVEHKGKILLDANSLYPTVMAQYRGGLFPSGAYKILEGHVLNNRHLDFLDDFKIKEVEWSMFEVDVNCPNDLLTPYLISRNAAQEVCYDLLPKRGQFYFGFSLLHAITLGYQVLRVHTEWRWLAENCGRQPVFRDFILKNVQLRKDNPAPSSLNYIAKTSSNAVYGGTIIKIVDENLQLIPVTDIARWTRLADLGHDLQPITDSDNSVMAYLVKTPKQNIKITCQAIHLGGGILDLSKLFMSEKFFCLVDAYRNPAMMVDYQDTDSALGPAAWLPLLEDAGMIGDELGQFKDDLGGGRVVKFIALGPKTYCLIYLSQKDGKVYCKTRMKAIPHDGRPRYMPEGIHEQDRHRPELLLVIDNLISHAKDNTLHVDPRFKAYLLTYADGRREAIDRVGYSSFRGLLIGEITEVTTYFGMFKTYYANTNFGQGLSIAPLYVQRSVLAESWWAKGKRLWFEDMDGVSVPPGYGD